ncbi:MAG: hypothetical protein M3406_05070 [Chloroflexota bacterium]|nr:hypothetical protein [Chloroflexota bacterium]
MSHITQEVFHISVDCPCGWTGTIVSYREHLVREHCNVDGCQASADVLVSFGYRTTRFVLIGVRLGVCSVHGQHLRSGRMHMIVEKQRPPPAKA